MKAKQKVVKRLSALEQIQQWPKEPKVVKKAKPRTYWAVEYTTRDGSTGIHTGGIGHGQTRQAMRATAKTIVAAYRNLSGPGAIVKAKAVKAVIS